jgi:transposase
MTLPWRDILRQKDDDGLKCVHVPAHRQHIFWVLRSGAQWPDRPETFGPWLKMAPS